MKVGETEEDKRGGELKRRLKGVRKRRRARCGFECAVVGRKMRLVRVKEENDR